MPYIGNQPFGKTVRTITSETLTSVANTFYPTGGYTVGYVDVYLNGVRLTEAADFTATDGSTVTLLFNPLISDTVDIVSYGTVEMANAVRREGDTLIGTLNTRDLVPTANVTYDIGTSDKRYRDLYLSGNTIQLGNVSLSTNGEVFVVANTTGGVLPSELGNTTITGTLTANDTNIVGSANVIGILAAGNTTVTGTLTANDTTIVGTANVTGVLAAGNTTVTGLLTANDTNIVGTANVSGILSTGNTTITGSANVTGILSANLITANTSQAWHQAAKGTHILRAADFEAAISANTTALKIFPATNIDSGASRPVNSYWGGISLMMLDPEIFGSSYTGSQIWIGAKVYDNPGQERSSFVIATNSGTTAGTQPIERFKVDPFGVVTKPYNPAFRAYLSTEWTTVPGQPNSGWAENFDQNGNFNQGTFTAPVSGIYKFGVMWDSFSTATTLSIRKNGANIANFEPSYADGWESNQLHTVTNMSVNDYVDIYVSGGSGNNPIHMGGGVWGYFYGYLLG